MLVLTYAKRTNKQKRLKEAENASDTLSTLCINGVRKHIHVCISSLWAVARSRPSLSPAHHLFSILILWWDASFSCWPTSLELGDSGGQDGFPSVLEHCSWLLYMGVGQAHSCLSLLAAVASPAFIPARQSCSSTATYTTHREELACQLISLS